MIAGIHPASAGQVSRPRATAVITQVHVFSGTLRENLTLARPDATDDEVRAALSTTDALGLVDGLPGGWTPRLVQPVRS